MSRIDPPDKHQLPVLQDEEEKQATKSDYWKALTDAWRFSRANRFESILLFSAWTVYLIYYVGYAFGKDVTLSWSQPA